MDSIQPYIDLGWHTVPLSGQLVRLEDGSKTIPDFPKNWRVDFQNTINEKATRIGGTITGEVSGIIAIDCDNALTWQLFRSFDPSYEFVFLSKGKGKECGTFIYAYDEELADSFGVNDGEMALDFYSNRGFVYLPTQSNRTKHHLANPLPELTAAPAAIKLLLRQLAKKVQPAQVTTANQNILTANCLNPLIKQLCEGKKFMPGVFKILTPKDFRSEQSYISSGYLHPNEVPEGRGSEYLSKVSAILGADISIDQELYAHAMTTINGLFDDPLPSSRLEKTILDPMLEMKAAIGGIPIWKYEPSWSDHRLILQGKRQTSLEMCFDDKRNMYYVVDTINSAYKQFNRDSELMAYIEAAAVAAPKKADVKRSLPIANVSALPHKPFGFNESDDPTARLLNTFIQTPELAIFSEPDTYIDKYKRPTMTLNYMETLMPERHIREYVLSFLKTKFNTFSYSPVIIYFMGAHGSGKDLFVSLLEIILGHVSKPTVKEFLELFNGYLLDSYFVQLDEYGNQLTSAREREEALGKLKAYTGKQRVQIRQMRTDGFMYDHNATFIMTANRNPLMLEEGDRRITFVSTPNVLADQPWVLDAGGIAEVVKKIFAETKDFCYYLATEVKSLSSADYVRPPESANKHKLIADSMYAAQRIAYAIKHDMLDYLVELAIDFGVPEAEEAFKHKSITTVELNELYDEMTDGKGDHRSLFKILRSGGVDLTPTTRDGVKCFRVRLDDFVPFKPDGE